MDMKMRASGFGKALLGGTALSIIFASPLLAAAQENGAPGQAGVGPEVGGQIPASSTPSAAESSDQAAAEVVVTGSRIARRDFAASSPLVTVAPDQLQRTGEVNVDRALAQLPQFNATTSTASGGQTDISGNGAIATLDLRGLGANRTLVLLDGRRLPIANTSGEVDVSAIPTAIVGNVEVITGGASAVYGSDAISGVVNFITRKNFTGTEISGQKGITGRGDGSTTTVSVVEGQKFDSGRGHVLLSATYNARGPVSGQALSGFLLRYVQPILSNGSTNLAGPNAPTQAAVNAVFAKYGVSPGTVVSPSFGFNSDGTLFSVLGGLNLRDNTGNPNRYITSPVVTEETDTSTNIVSAQKQYSLLGKADYEILNDVRFYVQGLYSRSDTTGVIPPRFTIPALSVPVTNPFIPADLAQILASRPDPTAPFAISKSVPEFGDQVTKDINQTYQIVAGLEGHLTLGDSRWEIYYSRGGTSLKSSFEDAVLTSKLAGLLNAPDGGASICAGGYNPFGLRSPTDISPACKQYLTFDTDSRTKTTQNVLEGTFSGTLIKLPAGDARFSLTGTYRDDTVEFTPDPIAAAGGTIAMPPTTGFPRTKISVKEAAGELLLPIVRDLPLVKSLELTLGGRYSDYNIIGSVKSYKAEGNWRVTPWLALRGGFERAVRAPNFAEALQPNTLTFIGVGAAQGGPGDPCSISSPARQAGGDKLRDLCLATGVPASVIDSGALPDNTFGHQGGNLNLKPERANTFTIGTVLTPRFSSALLHGLSASVDYYNISIDGVIATISGANTLLNCYNVNAGGNPGYDPNNQFCKAITRDSNGALSDVITEPLNLGGLKTSGIDVNATWTIPLGANVRLTLATYANYLMHFKYQALPHTASIDFAGYFGDTISHSLYTPEPHPRWKLNSRVGAGTDRYDVTVIWRYISGMPDVSEITTPQSALGRTKSNSVFDLQGRVKVTNGLTMNAGILNIFDKNPPTSAGVAGFVALNTYDFLGRRFFVGATMKF